MDYLEKVDRQPGQLRKSIHIGRHIERPAVIAVGQKQRLCLLPGPFPQGQDKEPPEQDLCVVNKAPVREESIASVVHCSGFQRGNARTAVIGLAEGVFKSVVGDDKGDQQASAVEAERT